MKILSKNKPLVISILGPTASGKTAASIAIAKKIPCEIISVDSAMIYKYMNVGTAKPSASEQSIVKHHLIDILDPKETYSVAQFRDNALSILGCIIKRNKLPILVGGSMLYFKGLKDGLDELPKSDPSIRKMIESETKILGIKKMHQKLSTFDPITSSKLSENDTQRIQRAIEVFIITGKPLSELLNKKKYEFPFELLSFSLEPNDRGVLHNLIEKRFDKMLISKPSIIDETEQLKNRKDLHLGLTSMKCVGYKESWEYLDGKFDKTRLREKAIIATRQLAKRQLTWLKRMKNIIKINSLSNDHQKDIIEKIKSYTC